MNQREIDAAAKRLLGKRPSTEEDILASLGMRVTSAEIDAALGVAQAALGLDNLQFSAVCLMRAAAYFGDPPEAGGDPIEAAMRAHLKGDTFTIARLCTYKALELATDALQAIEQEKADLREAGSHPEAEP